ncbi:MAG: molybdenum cofactor biosynthesis protein MoaE [Saprospiraceae bacterium]|nr:molybdenum cofactor biosynthesis protein MoaE [Saprospiraceae bacterium]
MADRKIKNIFVEGPVSSDFIAKSISNHSSKYEIGAHSIFLGQIRKDLVDGKAVRAIDYTAYEEMANEKCYLIRESAFEKYKLTCMHIYHSLGRVEAGEISLFVFTSAAHRKEAMEACTYIVDRIKGELPVWGKELLDDESYVWKENKH